MLQQQIGEQNDPANHKDRWLRSNRWAATAGAVCLVVGLGLGYALGHQRPAMHEADVRCMSAPRAISCTDAADAGKSDFWVPRDIAWTDTRGSLHVGDRPACLPPSGRGLEGPLGITWVTVEVAGTSWKQAVGVQC